MTVADPDPDPEPERDPEPDPATVAARCSECEFSPRTPR